MSTVSTHGVLHAGARLLAVLGLLAAAPAWSQVPVDEQGNPLDAEVVGDAESAAAETFALEEENLSLEELEALVGPIALYPDDLLAVVLPASAYPLQIVQAARFLEQLEQDPGLEPDESWDDSVVALLNYPEVLKMMNEDLEWTYELGEAVVRQQPDVIAAIEAFRDKAYAAGNLKSDDRQTVTRENGVIEIAPASEDVIYVPYYEPERVVVYQPQPVYHYYPRPYPVYYYPYPYGYSFASGYFWGVTTAFHIGWLTDHLHVWHHSYWGHPFFGHTYYFDRWWYRRPSIHVHNTYYVHNHVRRPPHYERDGDFWRPRRHSGAVLDRRGLRDVYYADRGTRSTAGYRRDAERNRVTDRNRVRSDLRRDDDTAARFARNRPGATLQEREERRADAERRRVERSASEREPVRFRARPETERADLTRRAERDDAVRLRPRDGASRAEPARRADGDTAVRFRSREPARASGQRELSERMPERRTIERPAIRRDEPTRRATPPRAPERSQATRPSSGAARSAASVSRPPAVSRPAPRASRPSTPARAAPRVSRPAAATSRSSSTSSSRAAPTSRSTRRSHRD